MDERFIYDDGGRTLAGYKGDAKDCVVRAIAIAENVPYSAIYKELQAWIDGHPTRKGKKRYVRLGGASIKEIRGFLDARGWTWRSVMGIGTGTTMHLRREELPSQKRLIMRLSRHLCAVIDGVIHDTYDPSRDGFRAVYGYWFRREERL